MGLDHGLNATVIERKTISGTYEGAVFDGVVATETPIVVETEREVEAGYWRKVNQVHNWFVENVQSGEDDCGTYEVGREQLANLKSRCERVLADPTRAEELLPTTEGFFFGGTEYDDYYQEGLRDTIRILDQCLAMPADTVWSYWSSW